MTRYRLLCLILCAFAISAASAEPLTYTYKTAGGIDLKAHVIVPAGHDASAKAPALLFYHGGGFRVGSPQAGFDIGEALAKHGVVTVSFQYRLLTAPATMDQIIADGKSSVRWTREHAMELGIDPDKIVAAGHSAGGYLAAATQMLAGFDEPSENHDVSSQPNAMVLWSPAIIHTEESLRSRLPEHATLSEYLPAEHISSELPPTIFIHGTADENVPHERSIRLNREFLAAGVDSELFLLEGVDHYFRDPTPRAEVARLMHNFINKLGYLP
jgi:acetyl esterase